MVNNSVDWLPFGYGSYFLLNLIVSASPVSGAFLPIKHGLKFCLCPVLAANFSQTPCRIRFLLLKYAPSHTLPCHTGRHRLSWHTDSFLNEFDGLQRMAQFLCEAGYSRCATSSSNTSGYRRPNRGVLPSNNPGTRGVSGVHRLIQRGGVR